ncbi:MAG: phosphatidate cytidylyltransferase [Betaproteobacteria bacterium]|nr:phosphatidate cytidylyltransferase [Betaproteobacteria bacterium]
MLKTRIITALVILPIVLIALFLFPRWAWALFAAIVMGAATWEWARLSQFSTAYQSSFFAVVASLAALSVFAYLDLAGTAFGSLTLAVLLMAAAFWMVAVPCWLLAEWRVRSANLMMLTGLAVIIPTWVALLFLRDAGPWVILTFAVIVWIADIAAYFAGKRFGRHKLAPAISPGKTVEGVIGGLCAVSAYYFLWRWLSAQQPGGIWFDLLLGQGFGLLAVFLLLALFSVMGDLFESWMKRCAGLKDSSSLLPGHGGVLDRIDALTATLPLASLYLILLVKGV